MKRKNIGFQEIFEMIPRKRSDEASMGENDKQIHESITLKTNIKIQS